MSETGGLDQRDNRDNGAADARAAIGYWIREHREFLGISQEQLRRRLDAAGVHVAQSTLSRWEQGELAPPAELLAQLARALATSLDTLEEVLSRAARATAVDLTGRTVEELVEEGDTAARGGQLRRAVERYEAALDLGRMKPGTLSTEEEGRILVRLAWAHAHLWELSAARDTLRRISRLGELPLDLSLQALLRHLFLEQHYGDRDAARAFARLIQEEMAGAGDFTRTACIHGLAGWHYLEDRFAEALPLFREAAESWHGLDNPVEEARARAFLALCMARTGHAEEGRREARAALEQSRAIRALDVEVVALRKLGQISAEEGDSAVALQYLEDSAALARRAGLDAEEFISLWEARRIAEGERRARYERTLRRLLRRVHPRLPEAREFVAAGLAAREEEDER